MGGGGRGGCPSSQQGGEVRGGPGAVPSCSGRPRVQVIQDRLWSGQSACSRLLGSGAGRTLRLGGASGAVASPSPRRAPTARHGAQALPPLPQQGAAGRDQGRECPPGAGMGVLAGGRGPVRAARCPLPRAPRCTCSSGRTWMSSCSAWASSSSACSSPPAWPRWVPPPPPSPSRPPLGWHNSPSPAHPWASLAPCPLPACRQG